MKNKVHEKRTQETHHCGVPYARVNIPERAEAKQICAVLNDEWSVSAVINTPLE